jgi:hypothetical protein
MKLPVPLLNARPSRLQLQHSRPLLPAVLKLDSR